MEGERLVEFDDLLPLNRGSADDPVKVRIASARNGDAITQQVVAITQTDMRQRSLSKGTVHLTHECIGEARLNNLLLP